MHYLLKITHRAKRGRSFSKVLTVTVSVKLCKLKILLFVPYFVCIYIYIYIFYNVHTHLQIYFEMKRVLIAWSCIKCQGNDS